MYRLIGERIRALRLSYNLTREQLSEILDITPNHLGSVERGNRKLSFQKLIKIHHMFHTTMDFILMGESQEGPAERKDYNPFLYEMLNKDEREFMMKVCTAIISYNLSEHELQLLSRMLVIQSKQITWLREQNSCQPLQPEQQDTLTRL